MPRPNKKQIQVVTDLEERQIPPFLFVDVSGNSSDTRRLIYQLQRWLLWQYVNGDKPYVDAEAIELQHNLQVEYAQKSATVAQQRMQERLAAQRNYAELCRKIAESCLIVEMDIEDVGTKTVAWDKKIRDDITGVAVGSPYDLLNGRVRGAVNMGWHFVNADARVEVVPFLTQLRRRFDGFEYYFSFDRHQLKPPRLVRDAVGVVLSMVRGVEPEIPPYFGFTLRLMWRPSQEKAVANRVKNIISSHETRSSIPNKVQ